MLKNYAFIDSQNLNLGMKELGWALDYKRFRGYLKDKYDIEKAFLFIGHIPGNENLYRSLKGYGYDLEFKQVICKQGQKTKGNVDTELVLHAMIEYPNYNKALIITSDGDFSCLVKYLYQQGKLITVLSPAQGKCSILLKRAAQEKIVFINPLRSKLEYKK